jgi:hypothetical protein
MSSGLFSIFSITGPDADRTRRDKNDLVSVVFQIGQRSGKPFDFSEIQPVSLPHDRRCPNFDHDPFFAFHF